MADEAPTEDPSELRKAAEEGSKAKRENELLRKQMAFLKAGVDTDSKPGQALLANYAGDLTTDAIVAEATDWGLVKSPTTPTETDSEPAAAAEAPDRSAEIELQEMRDAASGQPAPNEAPEVDAYKSVFADFEKDREGGYSQTDATNRAIGRLVQKAAAGDPTAIFNQDEWEEKAAQAGHGAQFAR